MEHTNVDETVLYRDYYKAVEALNRANADYLSVVADIATQRQQAINRAIDIHITPAIARFQKIQRLFGILGGIALLAMLYSCSNNSARQVTDSSLSSIGAALGGLFTLVTFGVAVLCVIVVLWASSKVTDLNRRAKTAKEARPTPFR